MVHVAGNSTSLGQQGTFLSPNLLDNPLMCTVHLLSLILLLFSAHIQCLYVIFRKIYVNAIYHAWFDLCEV